MFLPRVFWGAFEKRGRFFFCFLQDKARRNRETDHSLRVEWMGRKKGKSKLIS